MTRLKSTDDWGAIAAQADPIPAAMLAAEVDVAPAHTSLRFFRRRFFRDRLGVAGLCVLAVIVVAAPLLTHDNPATATEPDVAMASSTPGRTPHE